MAHSRLVKIRIDASAYLENDTPSGIGHYTRQLALALSEQQGVALELTTGPFFRGSIDTRPHKVQTFFNKVFRKLASYTPFALELPYDLFMPSVDMTIFPNFASLRSIRSQQTVCVIHDLVYVRFPETVERKNLSFLKRVVPKSTQYANTIVTTSDFIRSELKQIFNLRGAVVIPIPPDANFDKKIIPKPSSAITSSLGSKKFIYFIGTLEPRKNITQLIEAYRLLPEHLSKEYALVLAGNFGWKSKGIHRLLTEAQSTGMDIRHLGYISQSDSYTLKKLASLVVIPSLYEGYGMQILETMLAGKPILVSDIPVFREVAGSNVRYFDPRSNQDLSRKINELLSQSQRTVLEDIEMNYKIAKSYSWESAAIDFIGIVEKKRTSDI